MASGVALRAVALISIPPSRFFCKKVDTTELPTRVVGHCGLCAKVESANNLEGP